MLDHASAVVDMWDVWLLFGLVSSCRDRFRLVVERSFWETEVESEAWEK